MYEQQTEILEAIDFFENILQTMPDDRVSLEFLGGAYEQIGAVAKAQSAWARLADEILKEGDAEHAQTVRDRLRPYLDDPAISMKSARLENLARTAGDAAGRENGAETTRGETGAAKGETGGAASGKTSGAGGGEEARAMPAAGHGRSRAEETSAPNGGAPVPGFAQLRMTAALEELSLAWMLHEHELLDAAEYENLTMKMTEGGEDIPEEPLSALLELQKLHPDRVENALKLLAESHSLPLLRLDIFSTPPETAGRLPEVFIRTRGVFPFAEHGDSLLVAVLNPLDAALRAETEALAKAPCTFFLAHPGYIDERLSMSGGEDDVEARDTRGDLN